MFKVLRYILALELVFGGQARLTDWTPSVRQRAMAKAEGYRRYLPFLPGSTPSEHSRNIGLFMLGSGIGLLLPLKTIQLVCALLGTGLAIMGAYAQRAMGVPYWLPCVNTVLGIAIACASL